MWVTNLLQSPAVRSSLLHRIIDHALPLLDKSMLLWRLGVVSILDFLSHVVSPIGFNREPVGRVLPSTDRPPLKSANV